MPRFAANLHYLFTELPFLERFAAAARAGFADQCKADRIGHIVEVDEDLVAFLEPRLARFMIPRFIRIVDDLPKTPTQKIEKHVLREIGLSAGDCWDRETQAVVIVQQGDAI